MKKNTLSDRISVVQGDIIRQEVDAIVNAANESLLGGGGVDGAIHRAAGPDLLAECRQLGGCPTGEARITRGYRLPANHVIHTAGPVWRGGQQGEAELLSRSYQSCFTVARHNAVRTIAFPSISTGAYGYPVNLASRIAVTEAISALRENPDLDKVLFVCYDPQTYNEYCGIVIDLEEASHV